MSLSGFSTSRRASTSASALRVNLERRDDIVTGKRLDANPCDG